MAFPRLFSEKRKMIRQPEYEIVRTLRAEEDVIPELMKWCMKELKLDPTTARERACQLWVTLQGMY